MGDKEVRQKGTFLRGKLSFAGALIVLISFFLPWVRACGLEMSGWDIATNRYGNVEAAPVFFVTLVCALLVLALVVLAWRNRRLWRIAGTLNALLSVIASYSVCAIVANLTDNRGWELLVGFWGTVLGLGAMFVGGLVDWIAMRGAQPIAVPPEPVPGIMPHTPAERGRAKGVAPPPEGPLRTVSCPNCEARNPSGALFCRECGSTLAESSQWK